MNLILPVLLNLKKWKESIFSVVISQSSESLESNEY